MQITINNNVIQRLKKEGFYPDNMFSSLFALLSLQSETLLLDQWDDYNTSRRAIILYLDLVDKGLWEADPESELHFKATAKGKELIEDLQQLMTGEKPQPKPASESVDDWIEQWLDLYPKGVAPGGKLLRSDKKSCVIKMKKFMKDYEYPKETILQATKEYLADRELQDFAFTKAAVYMIDKRGEGSELAAWCAKVKDQPLIDKPLKHRNSGSI